MQRKWQNCNKSDHAGLYFWFHHYFPSDKKILSCCFLFSLNHKKTSSLNKTQFAVDFKSRGHDGSEWDCKEESLRSNQRRKRWWGHRKGNLLLGQGVTKRSSRPMLLYFCLFSPNCLKGFKKNWCTGSEPWYLVETIWFGIMPMPFSN